MHIEQISNLDALFGMLALIAFATIIFRVVPLKGVRSTSREFAEADIYGHDAALPKYMVVASVALVVGSLHLMIRSFPSVAQWLAQGGYGGHLLRDIAYSHMMIVMGGTIAVTGLTWYCLPRILRRPLYSRALAELAFWGTVVGATGFYLSNAIFGGMMSAMVDAGRTPEEIDAAIGIWRHLTTGISATVMGLGYWTYVANVFLTLLMRGATAGPRPYLHLAKFFAVGAAALLVGTIQGVLQELPQNIHWLHSAGTAGQYIDPISHAHINLITGVLSIVAGVAFYLTGTEGRRSGGRRIEEVIFWTLIPGSVAFYLTFIFLGFREGGMIVDSGLSFAEAARVMGWLHTIPLAVSASVTLLGIWLFNGVMLRRVLVDRVHQGGLAITLGAIALFLGTTQGLFQAMPMVRTWMLAAGPAGEALADAHAQINIVGGILMMLLGTMLKIGSPMTAGRVPAALSERASLFMGGGAVVYYIAALASALLAGTAIHDGIVAHHAIEWAELWCSPGKIIGALSYAIGAGLLARFAWRATADLRADGWRRLKLSLAQNDSSAAPWRRRIPKTRIVAAELVVALFGFPGLGWILSGRAMIGVPMMMGGAAISWAVIPLLLSPYGDGKLPHLTPSSLELYLVSSALLSATVLLGVIWASGSHRRIIKPA